ncbi:phage holin [Dellaglioa algida]|uniref:phage holin n=1 Tax=Dellaglioa algida TaxID=105612 RepID=UPI0024C4D445|nr:phage holin [Dellaglioa algida]MDK1716417.1 phage holin [Dellaglioa algida]MDK1721359.1 phage holin [Dellaglioa algida]
MKNINVNWHSKALWVSLTSLFIVLIQQIFALFGLTLPEGFESQVGGLINTLLTIGGLFGIVYDTNKKEIINED